MQVDNFRYIYIYIYVYDIFVIGSQMSTKKSVNITTNDRVSVFLELAEAHRLAGEQVLLLYYTQLLQLYRCVSLYANQ